MFAETTTLVAPDFEVIKHPAIPPVTKVRLTSDVIFLDIDGVLNSQPVLANWYAECSRADLEGKPFPFASGDHPWECIDPDNVEHLNRIIAATDAVCVLSSSWRYHHSVAWMQKHIEAFGFAGKLISETPIMHGVPRGIEIAAWIAEHGCRNFVILDDDSDMHELKDKLIRTSFETGLLAEHVEPTIKLLRGDNYDA